MKKLLCITLLIALAGVMFVGKSAALPAKASPAASHKLIEQLFRAHNVPQTQDALSSTASEAVKINYYPVNSGSDLPGFFELKVSVYADGSAFKRCRFDLDGTWELYDLYDGQNLYRSTVENGIAVGPISRMESLQHRAVMFGIITFGLIPIIRQLQDPSTEIIYLGSVVGGQDKFSVKVGSENWFLYSDERHLIRRVEMGDKTLAYADYRAVRGVWLPFIQRLSVGGRLTSELVFTNIEINPTFDPSFFNRESLPNEGVR